MAKYSIATLFAIVRMMQTHTVDIITHILHTCSDITIL